MGYVQLPSVQLDSTYIDTLDATQATARSAVGPFSLADGMTLGVYTEALGTATYATFAAIDFSDINAATADEVASTLQAQLTTVDISVEDGKVVIRRSAYGIAGRLQISSGAAQVALGFDTDMHAGTDVTPYQGVVGNRVPEPNETGVSTTSYVRFTLWSPEGLPDLSGLQIRINNVIYFYQSALTVHAAAGSGYQQYAPDFWLFYLVPETPFPDGAIVDLYVDYFSNITLWSFVTADATAPQVSDGFGTSPHTLRITFNEPVAMTADASGALNPSNYFITRISKPAVQPNVVSVSTVDDSTVELVTDVALTFGAQYSVQVNNATDTSSNVIASYPYNTVSVTAYEPENALGRSFSLWYMLPEQMRESDRSGDLFNLVSVLQEITDQILFWVDRMPTAFDPDLASDDDIAAMLAELGNPFTTFDLSERDKRQLLSALMEIYQLKGTVPGLLYAIYVLLGLTVTVELASDTGWDLGVDELGYDAYLGPGGQYLLYAFDIAADFALTETQRDKIRQIANYMKPPHTHLLSLLEPAVVVVDETIDHVELGLSELNLNFNLH